jgi:hypothetical protein
MSGHDLTESGHARSSSSERSLYIVRTHATILLLSEAASVRTSSIHRPDGDPTEVIKTPARRISSYPTKSELLATCELFVFEFFGFLHFSRIPGIVFQPFSLQFSFRLLECYFFLEYKMHIFAMIKFLGLSCEIMLYLFFYQVLFITVILPNFCYPNKNIFGIFFFGKFLLDFLHNHVCRQSTTQGPSEACGR